MMNQPILSIETVKLTEKHKREAFSCHSRKCLVALAINEILCPGLYASVGVAAFSIRQLEPELELFEGDLSPELQKIVDAFDENKPVEATSFEIALPVNFLKPNKEVIAQ